MNPETHTCTICRRPTNRNACTNCETRIRNHLIDITEYIAIASHELRPGQTGGDGRGNELSIGIRVNALDFIAGNDVMPILESWEKDWRDYYHLGPYGPASATRNHGKTSQGTLIGIVAFLQQWLTRACDDHPAVDDFATEVRQCHNIAQTAARMKPPTNTTITCPADDPTTTTGLCGARITIHANEIKNKATCKRCRTTWDIAHLIHVAIATPNAQMWADPEAAAEHFGITPRTLQRWSKQGKVQRLNGRYELHSIHNAINHELFAQNTNVV